MTQGLTGGAVAAVVAALVSLPLHSPNDALFNTLAVAIASLVVGLAAGVLWSLLSGGHSPRLRFGLLWLIALAVVIGIAFGMNTQLDRSVSFGVPLAAIIFGLVGASMYLQACLRLLDSWRVAIIGVVVALALGGALATQGDQESGRLELPPRANIIPNFMPDIMIDAPHDVF